MHVHPYLSFEGRCEEALEFYKSTLGAKVDALMRYKDGPPDACGAGPQPPGGFGMLTDRFGVTWMVNVVH